MILELVFFATLGIAKEFGTVMLGCRNDRAEM
jgi:hypothetical protein